MNLAALPHALDERGLTCRAVIESPRGRVKYTYEPRLEAFELTRLLPAGLSFPLDFGFVPSTLAQDGDPLDILVLCEEPLAVGVVVGTRLIGVLEAEQTEAGKTFRNDRLIGVAQASRLHGRLRDVAEVGAEFADQITAFWVSYNALRGARFNPLALRKGPAAAALIRRHATG